MPGRADALVADVVRIIPVPRSPDTCHDTPVGGNRGSVATRGAVVATTGAATAARVVKQHGAVVTDGLLVARGHALKKCRQLI